MFGFRVFYALLSLGCLAFALAAGLRPGTVAARVKLPGNVDFLSAQSALADRLWGLAVVAGILALVFGLRASGLVREGNRFKFRLFAIALTGCYLALGAPLHDWIIDDAAITFAYSDNLVEGHGLVLQPGHAPEEAYSNTLWMLILALAAAAGASIPIAAKVLCAAAGVGVALLVADLVRKSLGVRDTFESYLMLGAFALGAPFVVWSVSGLEHALQTLLFVAIVAGVANLKAHRWTTSVCLAALVLMRPETPLVCAGVFAAYLAYERGRGLKGLIAHVWPIAVLPFAVFAALIAFRLAYFGDPLPNPYYSKASGSTALSLFNVFGGGWDYFLDWAAQSGAVVAAPMLALAAWRTMPFHVAVTLGIAAAQLAFVLYAGGDWMGMWRFMSPEVPLLAILAAHASGTAPYPAHGAQGRAMALTVAAVLALMSTMLLVNFWIAPTTPFDKVAKIGSQFAATGRALGVEKPSLAHHDAGGTSYRSEIRLIDLYGLGDRKIAKHLHDAEFIVRYLFVEEKPTFIFGARYNPNFAAGTTKFPDRPEFARDYVPIDFPGAGYMSAELHHVRRDAVREVPGIRIERDDAGAIQRVVVDVDVVGPRPGGQSGGRAAAK